MTDIKDLLGRAFDDEEPPLGIDRDEVFRAGKQKVRRRHRLAAGGVVAAVVVAAVGASLLTDFVDITPDKELPPAAEAPPAPPGPELPLTPTSTPEGTPPFTAERAGELTARLRDSIGSRVAVAWPGEPGSPGFRVDGNVYRYTSDVVEADGGEGTLQVLIDYVTPGTSVTCDGATGSCEVSKASGYAVARSEWTGKPTGAQYAMATVVLPDGTRVEATSSNQSRRMRDVSEAPSGKPALDLDELTNLITQAKFSVR